MGILRKGHTRCCKVVMLMFFSRIYLQCFIVKHISIFCEIPVELYTHLEVFMLSDQEDENLSACTVSKIAIPLTIEDKYAGSLQCNTVMNDFEYYKKVITLTVESNMELFKQLPKPEHFDWEKLRAHIEIELRKTLEQDKMFEDLVELSKYANSMFVSMDKYYQKITAVSKQLKERNMQDSIGFSKIFLSSDLPDCFLTIVTRSFLVENDFTDLYQRHISMEQIKLITTKNNRRKFERLCDKHNHWVKVFNETITKISQNRTKLIWYIDINNSKTFDELFKEKYVTTATLDTRFLQQLMDTVEKETKALEPLLAEPAVSNWFTSVEKTEGIQAITKMFNIIDN